MNADPDPNAQARSEPPMLTRSPEAIAELPNVRHSELKSISERLGAVSEVPRASAWEGRSQSAKAMAGAGLVGFVPFLVERPSHTAMGVYLAAIFVVYAAGLIFSRAAKDIQAERADSIAAIKDHIDKYILTTETPPRLLGTARRVEPASDQDLERSPEPLTPSPRA